MKTAAIITAAAVLTLTAACAPITKTATVANVAQVTSNTVTGVVTTNIVPVTNFVYAVNEQWQTAINTGTGATPLIPQPWGTVAAAGLGILSAVLGWIVRLKNKKAGLLDIVIEGVEKANSPEVKQAIAAVANRYGQGAALHAEVKNQT